VVRRRRRVDIYLHTSTVFGPRPERDKIFLVTRRAQLPAHLSHSLQGIAELGMGILLPHLLGNGGVRAAGRSCEEAA
jgi:hypothetical protein